jgi:translation initiation factor IF-3
MRRNYQKAKPKVETKIFLANEKITAPEVFLIDELGENVGILKTVEAIARAKEVDLDLVEVNPKANPPVAKIINLGQLKYEHEKKMHRQKVQQKKVEIKVIKLTFRIGKHDLEVRAEQAIKFLKGDDKLKVEMFLRGRERQHFDRAREIMLEFIEYLKTKSNLKIEPEQPLTKQPTGFTIILVNKK